MADKQPTVVIEVIENFRFAHRGVEVVSYTAGDVVEVEKECADIAVGEKWAKKAKAGAGKKPASVLAEEIADLEANIPSASADDKPALEERLAELKAAAGQSSAA